MKKIIYNLAIVAVALVAFSCSKAESLSPAETVVGRWTVAEFYVNGQSDGSGIFSRFYIEDDGTFLLEDTNTIPYVGDWTFDNASNTLRLVASDGTDFTFQVVYMEYSRMQLVNTVAAAEPLEIRYLLNRSTNVSY